jgi:succinoglycan biosynthesis transport protein ExoP
MTPAPDPHAPDLHDYARILGARKYGIAVITIAVVGATLFFTYRQTPIFEGEVKVLVRPLQSLAPSGVAISQPPNLDTERELILSQTVAGQVREDLRIQTPVDALLRNLRVEVVTDTEVLSIKYSDPAPATAARVANGFATAYVDFRRHEALDLYESSAAAVQGRIEGIQDNLRRLDGRLEDTRDEELEGTLRSQRDVLLAQLTVLQQRLLDLQSGATLAQEGAQVIQPAQVPDSPASPNKARNTGLALLVGLGMGVGFAFLRERLDDRVKSRHELEGYLGAPVMAAIPKVDGWRRREEANLILRRDPRSPISEAYRTLGTNIQYLASRSRLKVIMITSALGGDGKSTTASNLAVALAQAGKRAILISADLRRPRAHQFFNVRNDVGVSNVLSQAIPVSEVMKDPGVRNLRIVGAGPLPSDPAALLGSPRATELLESLRESADFVILDTPPVLAVADASILAPLVDGTVFVTDAHRSSRSVLVQARDQLENAGANIIGAVYNNLDPRSAASYPYYRYYSQYYGGDGVGSGRSARVRLRRGRRGKRSTRPPVWEEAGTTSDHPSRAGAGGGR